MRTGIDESECGNIQNTETIARSPVAYAAHAQNWIFLDSNDLDSLCINFFSRQKCGHEKNNLILAKPYLCALAPVAHSILHPNKCQCNSLWRYYWNLAHFILSDISYLRNPHRLTEFTIEALVADFAVIEISDPEKMIFKS